MVAVALVVKPTIYYFFGLYRRYWVYASVRELRLIAVATAGAQVVVALLLMLAIVTSLLPATFPRLVLFIDWLISLISVGGLRLTVRLIAESGQVSQKSDGRGGMRRALVVGAGDAGVLVVREMQRNPQLHMQPVAFVDDDPEKLRKDIHGVRVVGQLRDLSSVIDRSRAREVVIAIPSAPGDVVRLVTQICRRKGIPFRTMPGIYELIGGKVNVNRLREVEISDLLRRQPARIDDEVVGRTLTGKRVLVTGAGGSIGLELCRQVARWMPAQLVLLGPRREQHLRGAARAGRELPGLAAAAGDRRYSRPGADRRRLCRPQTAGRLSRRGAQARSADGTECHRGGHQQRARDTVRRRRRPGGGNRTTGADLDRQGGSAFQRDGGDQGAGGDDRPRRRPAHRPAVCVGAFRQRARQPRQCRAAVQTPDLTRRPDHDHPPGDAALLHDHPRGGPSGPAGSRDWARGAIGARCTCCAWASRCRSSTWPRT